MECTVTSTLSAPATALDASCARLRSLNPDYPRMYAVASMADEGKRRWWSLADDLDGDRVPRMWARSLEDVPYPDVAAMQVATSLIHAVVGRVTALVVLEGRAWDPGLENLWIHMDSDGGIDWAGLADDTMRVLPDDPWAGTRGTVTVPCERALLVWTVHRCLTSLHAIFDAIARCTPIDASRFWGLVGEAVLGTSTYVPILAGEGESAAQRRGQGILDAFVAAGAPVRWKTRLTRIH
ncbi:hypothetical protein ACH47B_00415 [Rhodococcus sp. NPDC019627]|uniref:hypothetical protein n=1 Tax=unclassified Rhodococcus (in: high G+C Gram-positive bacteria) TaxID=192944 RepID=UPI0037967CDD